MECPWLCTETTEELSVVREIIGVVSVGGGIIACCTDWHNYLHQATGGTTKGVRRNKENLAANRRIWQIARGSEDFYNPLKFLII